MPALGDTGFTENQLAAFAYFTPIPAIALLIFEPYSRHEFLRFHSYQCLLLAATALIVSMFTPVFAFLLPFDLLLGALTQLAILAMWVMAALGAWRGERTLLPIIGPIAAKKARMA